MYFLRHASAGQHKLNPKHDEERPLDATGKRQSRDMGRALKAFGVEIDVLISSPLTRATQMAEIVAREFGHDAKIVTHEAMRPESDYDQFQDLLTQYGKSKSIMVTGHNPSITEFLMHLLTGRETDQCIELKKGALAKVEIEGGKAVLHWLITPKMASKLQADSTKSSRPKTSRK